jgi:hypothetical protein
MLLNIVNAILTVISHSHLLQHPVASSDFTFVSGGKSMVGFPEKKPSGLRVKPVDSQGMTGKSADKAKNKIG